ncbi:phosphotransferase [Streptomyces sp. NPDC058646]|uniref:phosphotransferase n=1 Tax=Streptomyces sp. NPDC058646 TaxID=3346574 RepID=UPI0036523A53
MPGTMHDDEADIDEGLVGRLVAAQFPARAGLPVAKVRSAGTDNAVYRLGEDLAVRLPRVPDAPGRSPRSSGGRRTSRRACRWRCRWAGACLGEGFAMPWSVYRWIDGRDACEEPLADPAVAAAALGGFVAALRKRDATGGPPSWRGVPLSTRDEEVRAAVRDLGADGTPDAAAATAAWEEALRAPRWEGRPVWLHGDLRPGNLLGRGGRLSAVIDFGGVGVGDPDCDTMAAWTVLPAGTREPFREAVGVDDATWARGRGWALAFGLTTYHHYRGARNPVLAEVALRAVREALSDDARALTA